MRRGQAVVEAALGIFVFVTILIFGIHFAELGAISLEVQEAANHAVWDSTSRQMHDVTAHEWNQYNSAIAFANSQAMLRYADFDALRTSGTTTTLVFTRATNVQVACRALGASDRLQPSDAHPLAQGTYPDGDHGLSCLARADLTGFRIPTNFLDGNMSNARHYRPLVIPACAVGRPVNGNCPGRLGMLLDDWGYVGQDEARECALGWEGKDTCANQGYYDQALSVYQATPAARAGSASRLAAVVAGGSPIDEDFFFISFRGSEGRYGPYTESVQSSHGDLYWETTPFQHPRNVQYDGPRSNCWLGNPCR